MSKNNWISVKDKLPEEVKAPTFCIGDVVYCPRCIDDEWKI